MTKGVIYLIYGPKVAELADWAGQYDRHVRRLLRDRDN